MFFYACYNMQGKHKAGLLKVLMTARLQHEFGP